MSISYNYFMEQDKKCENCIHYNELFIIYKARYRKCGGFCGNKRVYKVHNKNKYAPKPCDKWEQKPSVIEAERENCLKVLKDIRKRLSEISLILKDD